MMMMTYYLFGEKSFKTMQTKFCKKFNLTITSRKVRFIVVLTNFKPQGL